MSDGSDKADDDRGALPKPPVPLSAIGRPKKASGLQRRKDDSVSRIKRVEQKDIEAPPKPKKPPTIPRPRAKKETGGGSGTGQAYKPPTPMTEREPSQKIDLPVAMSAPDLRATVRPRALSKPHAPKVEIKAPPKAAEKTRPEVASEDDPAEDPGRESLEIELDGETKPAPSFPPTMARFGRYNLVGRLAVGGMAEIYLAQEVARGDAYRNVVVKVVRPQFSEEEGFADLFLNEGRVAMQLSHPNICHIYEFGEYDDRLFLSMEYVQGVALKDLIARASEQRKVLPVAIVIRVIAQVAEALSFAHSFKDRSGATQGIVHRDVSPHNVMISYDGVVKLLDFGVAKIGFGQGTFSGTVKGKFGYMSPEQCMGHALDGRSDIFSLGVCLYEGLAGRKLFKRPSQYDTFKAIIEDPPPDLGSVRKDVPEGVERVLARALAKEPSERYATAAEMQHDLEKVLVEIGEVVNTRRIGRFMHGLYKDEIKAGPVLDTDPELLARIAPPPASPSVEAEDDEPKAAAAPPLPAVEARSRPRWLIPSIVAGVLAVFLIGVSLGTLGNGGEDTDDATAPERSQDVSRSAIEPSDEPGTPQPEPPVTEPVVAGGELPAAEESAASIEDPTLDEETPAEESPSDDVAVDDDMVLSAEEVEAVDTADPPREPSREADEPTGEAPRERSSTRRERPSSSGGMRPRGRMGPGFVTDIGF